MAQMILAGNIKSDISVTATHIFDLATGTVPLRNTQTYQVSSAVSSITCDLIWQDAGTIAGGGAAVNIDLNDLAACGGLMEYWGVDGGVLKAQFDRVHYLYIRNTTVGAAAGESVMTVGLDAIPFEWFFNTPATDAIEIAPGGFVLSGCGVDAGWAVNQAANDVLQIANNDAANAMTYEIIVIGESQQSASTTTTSTTTAAPTTTTAAPTTTTT